MEKRPNSRQAVWFLGSMYLFGLIGIGLPLHRDIVLLTPFNLLVSLGLALYFHIPWTIRSVSFFLLCYVLGFGAELFGVQTGLLFGEYQYGQVLGPKIWGTPLLIGANWMLLSYGGGCLSNLLWPGRSWIWRGVAAAALLVGLDLLIEPVAMTHGFWSWAGDTVPLRNYLGWFAVALPLQLYFAYFQGNIANKVAIALFFMQFAFFLLLGLRIWIAA